MIATQGHQDQSIRIHKYVLLPQFCLPSQHKKIDKNLILLHFFFITRLLPKLCQMMLFSATYDEDVMKFAEMIIRNPVVLK